jgi:hypothetical protein
MKLHTFESMRRDAPASHLACSAVIGLARLSLLWAASAVQLVFAQQPSPSQQPAEYCQNPSTKNITWSLGRPPERFRFPDNSVIQFTVTAADQGLCDLRLMQSSLQDVTTFFQLDASQLRLCIDNDRCDTEIDVPPNSTRGLEVRIDPNFHTPGIFTGELAFAIKDKPETQSFKLTVYSRTRTAMLLGAFLIALGMGLYFLVNVSLRRRIAVDDALLPAYQLRDTIETLKRRVVEATRLTNIPLPALTNALTQLEDELASKSLAAHLPSLTVLPWSSGTAWVDGFKAYLTPRTDRTAALVVLVNSGVQAASAYWTTFPTPVATALAQIDLLAPNVTDVATAQAQLAPILQALYAAVNPRRAEAFAPMSEAVPSNVVARFFTLPPDTHTLLVRLFRNALWVWWLVALIALASGFYSVVLENFGFGSWTDYIKCFFWGLGFSVAGTQLDQLTQTAVTGNFGITIPKA